MNEVEEEIEERDVTLPRNVVHLIKDAVKKGRGKLRPFVIPRYAKDLEKRRRVLWS